MAAVTPDAFGAAGYVDVHSVRDLGWKQTMITFRTTNVANGDTWASAVPVKRIAYVIGTTAGRSAPTLSADRRTVTFNNSATITAPVVYVVWY